MRVIIHLENETTRFSPESNEEKKEVHEPSTQYIKHLSAEVTIVGKIYMCQHYSL